MARVLAVGIVMLASVAAQAKTLYVNGATGDDALTYAQNSESTPWRSIGRAAWGSTDREARNGAEAAKAGDTVLVAAGTYATGGTNSRNECAYYTENSGLPGAPIVFLAQGLVTLTLSSGAGAVIGAYQRNYITWDGFTIHEAQAPSVPDTGPVVISGCTGCVLQNLDINGNGNAGTRMDNHNGIRLEGSTQLLIRNNRVQNVHNGSNPNNGSCLMTYGIGAVTIEHNELFNCGSGVFIKGGPTDNIDFITIRYNLIYNIGRNGDGSGIILHAGAANTPDRPSRIYQNVVHDVLAAGLKVWRFSPTDPANTPMNGKFVNNTVYNVPTGFWVDNPLLANAGFVLRNNLMHGVSSMGIAFNSDASVKSQFDSENNFYGTSALFAQTPAGDFTMASWRSTYGQDLQSMNADPMFVDAAGNDFRLQTGSPARTAGRDWLDLNGNGSTVDTIPAGAYITGSEVIGRTNGPLPTRPSAPSGLRLVSP